MKSSQPKILVCDFPSRFLFPSIGYGAIENWLYTVAYESVQLGYQVFLSGPQWRSELLPQATFEPESILKINADAFLKKYGQMDFLVAGHEYWHSDELRNKFATLAKKSVTFQGMPDPLYKEKVFDNQNHFLYCYSDEMCQRFKLQNPQKLLFSVHGYNEEPAPQPSKGYLVWIGRLDRDKAPHLAIQTAIALDMPVYLLGSPIRGDKQYNIDLQHLLESEYVIRHTSPNCPPYQVTGEDKMNIIGAAACALYTLDREYIEAAGCIFAEYLRSGVPIAALSWKGNDSPFASIDQGITGSIYTAHAHATEMEIVEGLAKKVQDCLKLDRNNVLIAGQKKFSPKELVFQMFNRTSPLDHT